MEFNTAIGGEMVPKESEQLDLFDDWYLFSELLKDSEWLQEYEERKKEVKKYIGREF